MHLRAREYAPSIGAFMTVDPLKGTAGQVTVANPYAYAGNDPLDVVDPLGLRGLRDADMRQPYGWATWSWAQKKAWVASQDSALQSMRLSNPWSAAGLAAGIGRGVTNTSIGITNGVIDFGEAGVNTILSGPIPGGTFVADRLDIPQVHIGRLGPYYTDDSSLIAYAIGTGVGVVAPGVVASSSSGPKIAAERPEGLTVAGGQATVHGAERLTQAGFTEELIAETRAAYVTTQVDGASVFVREVSPGRFDFFVESENGVATAHRGWSLKSVSRLAASYGWEGWPP